jgi:hypothetical protein
MIESAGILTFGRGELELEDRRGGIPESLPEVFFTSRFGDVIHAPQEGQGPLVPA